MSNPENTTDAAGGNRMETGVASNEFWLVSPYGKKM